VKSTKKSELRQIHAMTRIEKALGKKMLLEVMVVNCCANGDRTKGVLLDLRVEWL
jgi:hypothetical protein